MTFVSYAQNFEDYLLWRTLGTVEDGFYIDVGANDPDLDSVSKAFWLRGWRGIEIEPLPHLAGRLRAARPGCLVVESAVGAATGVETIYAFDAPAEGISTFDAEAAERQTRTLGLRFSRREVPVRRLDEILRDAAPDVIHWMKIDVEGLEAEVLEGLDLAIWRPWILVVEATAPSSQAPTYQGWEPAMLAADYRFAYFDGLNRYYAAAEHEELVAAFASPVSVFDDVRRISDILVERGRDLLARALDVGIDAEAIAELYRQHHATMDAQVETRTQIDRLCAELGTLVDEIRIARARTLAARLRRALRVR